MIADDVPVAYDLSNVSVSLNPNKKKEISLSTKENGFFVIFAGL
jgi:hypothetical protein